MERKEMEQKMSMLPFEFKQKVNAQYSKSKKYGLRQATIKVKDNKKLKRILKLRRIHLQTAIRVKKNGCAWWSKLMNIYYGNVTGQDIVNCKQNTTSNVMLQFRQIRSQSQSFSQMFLFNNYPKFYQSNTCKFAVKRSYRQKVINIGQEDEEELMKIQIFQSPFHFKEVHRADEKKIPLSETKTMISVNQIEKELKEKYITKNGDSLKYLGVIKHQEDVLEYLHYLEKLQKYKDNTIDCQIEALQQKLSPIHQESHELWDKVLINFLKNEERLQNLKEVEKEIPSIQEALACRNRLLYFKRGFSDKTEDELEQALQELQLLQKGEVYSKKIKKIKQITSYNDCKICFNPQITEKNTILYCTQCATSFHHHCYGLSSNKYSDSYICDVCLWMEQNQYEFYQIEMRPLCEICFSKTQFPMKKINKHFYHVTCLFFFQFAEVRSFKISLKEKAQKRIKQLKQSNEGSRCQYCLPENEHKGCRLKCSECQTYFHPICAYLRGCKFSIDKEDELDVRILCSFHTFFGVEDDEIRQVYLRRYFCNYKNIHKTIEIEFIPIYMEEKRQIQTSIQQTEEDSSLFFYNLNRQKKIKKNEQSIQPLQTFRIEDYLINLSLDSYHYKSSDEISENSYQNFHESDLL